MPSMLRMLKSLLVAAAACATVLVGLRESLSAGLPAGIAVRSLPVGSSDGSREDDSGTLSEAEQVEEDDTEEHKGRGVHLCAAFLPVCGLDAAVHPSSPAAPPLKALRRSRATHARGPPALR